MDTAQETASTGDVELIEFMRGYMETALWSSCGPDKEPHKCENLDDLFGIDDISPECYAAMEASCKDFIQSNLGDLAEYCKHMECGAWTGMAHAGHDFWLTRNGHGAGFWCRDLGELGQRLTKASKVYGEVFLYPGDDGLIYGETQ